MPDQPCLYALAGLPGSGKSSFAEKLRATESPNALVLSSDDVRWTMSMGHDYKAAAERYVIEVMAAYSRGCLLYNRSVIYDATNLTRNKRSLLSWYAHEYGARAELYYIQCRAAESARRSKKWIPLAAIQKLAGTFEYPSKEDEGWDKVVTVDGENGWAVVSVA